MKSLEDYDVISVIGTGNFGTCYKVRDKNTSEIYAWKTIDYDDGSFSETKTQTLSSEIDLLRQLNHPNIVQYFDHILNYDSKMIFIIMEYCAGGDLANLVMKCNREHLKFEEKYIWRVLQQLCKALQFCHNKIVNGIILHRDIKPANVFLDSQGNAKLGDFGLARILRRNCDDFAETLVGTPYYMSPEIVRGRKYNRKSDIWAVGCLIYEMCALKPPFKGRIFHQLSKNITNGQFSCIPECYSKDLQVIITFMLEVDSEYRPTVDIILRHPILLRNLTDLNNEFPNLISSTEISNKPKKLDFSPNLSSTILTHFSINHNDMDESNGKISGVNTPSLRAELFGTIKRKNYTNSNPELNKMCNIIDNTDPNKYLINYCPDDPEILTKNIFEAELKRRLQSIRAQESLLKQKTANILAREKELNEREIRIAETEKQLTERKIHFEELLKRSRNEIGLKKLPKRPTTFDDTYCTLEPNDTIIESTVAKINLATMQPPTFFPRKSVTFHSPKKFIKYNIENIPPSSSRTNITKSSSLRIENNSHRNKKNLKLNNFTSSLSGKSTLSEDSQHSNKRKSILSIFGINITSKSNLKDNKNDIKFGFNKDDNIVTNQINEEKEILQKIETTNLTKCWTTENKKAAFELLAAMNAGDRNTVNITESNENCINKIKQNWRKSTREKTVLQRTKQRRSMMILSDTKNILM